MSRLSFGVGRPGRSPWPWSWPARPASRPATAPAAPRRTAVRPGNSSRSSKKSVERSIDLEKVRLQKLDGRLLLVGTGCDTPDNWQKGKTVWVALDDVSEITTFATLDELRKAGILPDDLRIDTLRSGGAGGQHVNKTSWRCGSRIFRPASW